MKKILNNKFAMFALAALAVIVTFIFLSNPVTGCALAIVFPLIVKVGNKDFTVKSQEEKDQMDQLLSLMNAITEKAISGYITAEEASTKIAEKIAEKGYKLEDDAKFKEYATAVVKQGQELKALTEKGGSLEGKTIEQQLREQITAKKSEWEDYVNKKSQQFVLQLNLKTAAMIPTNNAGAGTIPYQFLPGIVDIFAGRVKPFLIDLIGVKHTTSPTIYWTNKTSPSGTVAFIYDTGTLTQIDFTLTAESSTAKNVGDYIKIHENMLNDIPYMASCVQNELIYQIKHIADSEVWSGVGTTVHLKGISAYASSFSLTSLAYLVPNIYDVILACKTQIINSSDMFDPDIVLLNPVDFSNMIGSKNSQGSYVIPPFASMNGDIAGMTIYQSNLISVGYIGVIDSKSVNLYELGNMTIEMGFDADDFTKMLRTFRGYMRLHCFISDNKKTSFVYDTIANVKAAIVTI